MALSNITKLRIIFLKKKAGKLYLRYHSFLDDYGCGTYLAEHLSLEISLIKNKYNKTMDKLAKIDPDCPETRL